MEAVTLSKRELDRLSVIERLARREIKQTDAARLLNRSVRQVRRMLKRYRQRGAKGLASRRRGKPANNRLDARLREQIPKLIAEHYADFGPTLATEKLAERHHIHVSVESVRQLMICNQLWQVRRRRHKAVHPLRPPRPCRGEMIQVDGSLHAWFEDRAPMCCLIVFVDDATSEVPVAQFWPRESTQAYMTVMRDYLERFGRPVSVYSDRHSIFRCTVAEPAHGQHFTQFGRVLETLEIEALHATSPQAKGRVERSNRTLQDRLIKELRLEGISDIDTANAFLPYFLTGYNQRFGKPPQIDIDVHRPVRQQPADLDLILSRQHSRTVSKNLSIQFNNTVYQLIPGTRGHRLKHTRVVVCEHFDGHIDILAAGKPVPYEVYARGQPLPPVVDEKQLNARVDAAVQRKARSSTPKADHPWRHFPRKVSQPVVYRTST